jgi:acetyl-CoA C-acetyltransferase
VSQIGVLVGVGQLTHQVKEPGMSGEPVDYMVRSARRAAADAGMPDILQRLDSIGCIGSLSRPYGDAPLRVAHELGASPAVIVSTPIGATAPQTLLTRLCDRIARGQSAIGLICGAEAFYTGGGIDWQTVGQVDYARSAVPLVGDTRSPVTPLEQRYGLLRPSLAYAMITNATRAARGQTHIDYQNETARLCARLSAVAAENPYAWFKEPRSAAEIAQVTPENRMVDYPITKYMSAMMDVDQAAAVIIMSEQEASKLGVQEQPWVYLTGSAEACQGWYLSERDNLYTAPALAKCMEQALGAADCRAEDIDLWDLYSCFPVAVQLAQATIGLDPSGTPSVIGGLPYFGGPGNHYSLHAICELVRRLRQAPSKRGVVECLSWYMSKFAVGVYSNERPKAPTLAPQTAAPEMTTAVPIVEVADGDFTLESFALSYDRGGEAAYGVLMARGAHGERLLARASGDASLLHDLTVDEAVGRRVSVRHDVASGLNRLICLD